jgi:hypothetical protein
MISDSAPGFECQPIADSLIIVNVIWLAGIQSQVPSHWSLLMSFDWLAFKARSNQMTLTMISDSAPGFECQPIKWHEQWSVTLHLDLNVRQSNDINNDPLMSFDWLAFKVRCRVRDHYSCHLIVWHSKSGAESWIIVHVIWLVGIQSQVQSHGSLLMSFDWANQSNNINNDPWLCTWIWMIANQITLTMISDSAPDLECQPIKWH